MVVVKWSACSPSTPTVRVRIPLKSTVFSVEFVLANNENKQKEAGVGPLKKKILVYKVYSIESFYHKHHALASVHHVFLNLFFH